MKISRLFTLITSCIVGFSFLSCQSKGPANIDAKYKKLSAEQDSILEKMIVECKNERMRHYREQWDTSRFYVTFDFFTKNDTDIVWVMGNYNDPIVFHDKKHNLEKFIGCFAKDNSYCLFYNCLFTTQEEGKCNHFSAQVCNAIQFEDRSHTPFLFPEDLDGRTIDPYMLEYAIVDHQCILLRHGYW